MEKRIAKLRAEAEQLMHGKITERKLDRILEICTEIRKLSGKE